MGKINDLIAEKKYNAAAEILFQGIQAIINQYANNMFLTMDEFAAVAPALVEKFQDPTKKPVKPTPEPGDDVVIVDPFKTLTIKFEGPEDEDFIAPADIVKKYAMGQKYSYPCPVIKGYVANPKVVEGTMPKTDLTVTVKYEDATPIPPEPKTVLLNIKYVGPEGDTEFVAPAEVLEELEEGQEYMIVSPTVEGYTPDKANVNGAAGTEDISVTVTYAKNQQLSGEDEDLITG